jgi:tetratricopeptide (TPR) repeat protein
MTEASKPSDFFTAGGTLRLDSPSYVERPADDELFELALTGEFCYVLTTRQLGKSSLMVRAAKRLREHGASTAIIDLTKIGTREITIDQWYLGLITRLKAELNLTADPAAWWKEWASLGPVHRFTDFLRDVVLQETEGAVVIFVDEIDSTLNLDFSDDFFAAIRAMYNARASDPELNRLTFVLLGVATPTDLIKGRARTPFNIGQGIALQEFSRADAQLLERGVEAAHPGQGEAIFVRIFHWTNGHPYLTQKLCLAVAKRGDGTWTDERVDRLVEELFLSEEARQETNLRFVRDSIGASSQRRKLMGLYRKVYEGRKIAEDERSPDQNRLKLFGLVRAEDGLLRVRNEIYLQAFDLNWIKANTPVDWTRRVAVISMILVLLLGGLLGYYRYRQGQQTAQARAQAFVDNFRETTSADVRITSLAGLFELPGYEDQARQLFYEELTPEERLVLFTWADPRAVGTQLVIVVKGLYTELQDSDQDNQLLEAMARSLRKVDTQTTGNLATEIEQWLSGRNAYAAGEHQQAVDAYSGAIGLNDRNPGTHFDRGLAYAALGEPSQALADFETVLSLDERWQERVQQTVVSDGQLYAALWSERGAYPALAALVPTPTSTPTSTVTPTPTPTSAPISMATSTPTSTSTPISTATPTPTLVPLTPILTPTPIPTVVPQLADRIALTIYLRDTLTETGLVALSDDQVNGGEIYREGGFVYGEAAVQIGEMIYHFDKPRVGPDEPQQLPDPWWVEFDFDQLLVARTGNQAGFNAKKAQFWVGTLDDESAVGGDNPYRLVAKLYEGNELRESVRVFFAVKDAPGPGPGPGPEGRPRP